MYVYFFPGIVQPVSFLTDHQNDGESTALLLYFVCMSALSTLKQQRRKKNHHSMTNRIIFFRLDWSLVCAQLTGWARCMISATGCLVLQHWHALSISLSLPAAGSWISVKPVVTSCRLSSEDGQRTKPTGHPILASHHTHVVHPLHQFVFIR